MTKPVLDADGFIEEFNRRLPEHESFEAGMRVEHNDTSGYRMIGPYGLRKVFADVHAEIMNDYNVRL